ncbi:hypothetical protein [Planktosalinus lacus]|uniref:Lipoprotein n=1 Tax=Planktosalinus lacus TaxID=1526573 RepID=A0A8J2Y9T8_9FLAO|nr:hypothetical protein [Planktosalinus lacus]GGE00883.1 hypothetical protein GCM10011312_25380 [Planktosalinus lacus]
MSKIYNFGLLFLLTVFMISCQGNKNIEENTKNNIERVERNDRTNLSQTSRSIEQIIETWVESLEYRLKIDSKTNSSIQKIYMEAYISMGGNTGDILVRDQAQKIRHQIIKNTKNDVVNLLNTDQQNIYLRYIKD